MVTATQNQNKSLMSQLSPPLAYNLPVSQVCCVMSTGLVHHREVEPTEHDYYRLHQVEHGAAHQGLDPTRAGSGSVAFQLA